MTSLGDDITLPIIAVIGIIVLCAIAGVLISSTDNEDVQRMIQNIMDTGIGIIILVVAVSGAIGTIALFMILRGR